MRVPIIVAAAVVRNARGELLLVRKRGTYRFMLPGGKIEPGETVLQALAREVREELGATFRSPEARFLGVFTAAAANEPDHELIAHLVAVDLENDAHPVAEIEEIVWTDVLEPHSIPLAPLVTEAVTDHPKCRRHASDDVDDGLTILSEPLAR